MLQICRRFHGFLRGIERLSGVASRPCRQSQKCSDGDKTINHKPRNLGTMGNCHMFASQFGQAIMRVAEIPAAKADHKLVPLHVWRYRAGTVYLDDRAELSKRRECLAITARNELCPSQ